LDLRLQHRSKQGLFFRLKNFIGLTAEQIGDETLQRNMAKMTAMCWTRSIYHNPSLADLVWEQWLYSLSEVDRVSQPTTIPKNWQKDLNIAEGIIKICPFCDRTNEDENYKNIGNLEHLHMYCRSFNMLKRLLTKKLKRPFENYTISHLFENLIHRWMKQQGPHPYKNL
jgi:hypothetical protein